MSKRPRDETSLAWFRYFPSDFEAKTAHLTLLEDGAYNRLLRLCWGSPRCEVPADEEWIFRRMRAQSDDEKTAIRTVIEEFFQRRGAARSGRFFNPRLSEEFAKAQQRHRVAVENGTQNAKRAKALKNKEPEGSKRGTNQNQNQNQTLKKNTKKRAGDGLDGEDPALNPDLLAMWAGQIIQGRKAALSSLKDSQIREMLDLEMVTPDQLRDLGL